MSKACSGSVLAHRDSLQLLGADNVFSAVRVKMRKAAMRNLPFYALRDDLLPILESFESRVTVLYVRTGRFTEPLLEIARSGFELADLGIADFDSSVGCTSYLIVKAPATVHTCPVEELTGMVSYHVDQLLNPDSIVITAGGYWSQDVILSGNVGTASDTPDAQEMMKKFSSAMRKNFTKVRAYWVGPGAMARLTAGARLTAAVQCPPEYDLQQ